MHFLCFENMRRQRISYITSIKKRIFNAFTFQKQITLKLGHFDSWQRVLVILSAFCYCIFYRWNAQKQIYEYGFFLEKGSPDSYHQKN